MAKYPDDPTSAASRMLATVRARAGPHYRNALSLAGELGMRPLIARCHLGLGQLLARTGRRVDAERHLATAVAMLDEMVIPREPLPS
jgi:hypothetical protein